LSYTTKDLQSQFWQNEPKIINLFSKPPFTGPSFPFARGCEVIDPPPLYLQASDGSLHARTDEELSLLAGGS
jgi:hypothetical protein